MNLIMNGVTMLLLALSSFRENNTGSRFGVSLVDNDVVEISKLKYDKIEGDIKRLHFVVKKSDNDACNRSSEKWKITTKLHITGGNVDQIKNSAEESESPAVNPENKRGEERGCMMNIDKSTIPVQILKDLLIKISSEDYYYQEMCDFFMSIIFSQVLHNGNTDTKKIQKDCLLMYEKFQRPYLKDNYKLARDFDAIVKELPDYQNERVMGEDPTVIAGITEYTHTLLWFNRMFNFDDLTYIYAYFIESEDLHTPYMFLLSAVDIVRKYEHTKEFPFETLGEEKIKELIEKSKELDKKYRKDFIRHRMSNAQWIFEGLKTLLYSFKRTVKFFMKYVFRR
ncbi:hypothetical protein NEMIN01_0820 [Nematocida minor]|uniref:uncharacterized protein n=1 Tax=Nematocida minor TaxID=1912983 RepID=UPI0022203608|nr:uncharacterized protein NEMIN01_0820 [Nematocida minor]KAI5190035.1 hypothetical protein NEMIN01_0820 [Nematocida minor]